jgi:hypothetical protein
MEDTLFKGGSSKKTRDLGNEMHHWRYSAGCHLIDEFLDLLPQMAVGGDFILPHVKPEISGRTNISSKNNGYSCWIRSVGFYHRSQSNM